jgi:hypothetical protein
MLLKDSEAAMKAVLHPPWKLYVRLALVKAEAAIEAVAHPPWGLE